VIFTHRERGPRRSGGKLRANTHAALMKQVQARAYLAISERTMEFDGKGKCVSAAENHDPTFKAAFISLDSCKQSEFVGRVSRPTCPSEFSRLCNEPNMLQSARGGVIDGTRFCTLFAGLRAKQLGDFMKLKAICTIAGLFPWIDLVLSGDRVAAAKTGGAFPQPTPKKQVTVTEIPGSSPPERK